MADPRCEIYLGVGKSILRDYFDYNAKNPADDTEYIPIVRAIVEGILKEMKSSGMEKSGCAKVADKLKAFNRTLYENLWIEHAKEDQDPDEEPLDLEKERRAAQYTFDYIYKHGKHPLNLEF